MRHEALERLELTNKFLSTHLKRVNSMFKRTKTVILEIWFRSTIFVDPAPLPTDNFWKDLKAISKAVKEDIREAWQNQHQIVA